MSNEIKRYQDTEMVNGALTQYAPNSTLEQLVDRILAIHPAAKEVGKDGMRLVAQTAILMGASPLPGTNEIHVWKQGNKINVTLGINYWRRRAVAKGFAFVQQPRPMNTEEREMYHIADGEIAAICKGVPNESLAQAKIMMEMGFDQKSITEGISIIGIGSVKTDLVRDYNTGAPKVDREGHDIYVDQKNGRPLVWTAIKRAEMDLYKKLAPFAPGDNTPPGEGLKQTDSGYSIDTSNTSWKIEAQETYSLEAGETIDDVNSFLFGDDDVVTVETEVVKEVAPPPPQKHHHQPTTDKATPAQMRFFYGRLNKYGDNKDKAKAHYLALCGVDSASDLSKSDMSRVLNELNDPNFMLTFDTKATLDDIKAFQSLTLDVAGFEGAKDLQKKYFPSGFEGATVEQLNDARSNIEENNAEEQPELPF